MANPRSPDGAKATLARKRTPMRFLRRREAQSPSPAPLGTRTDPAALRRRRPKHWPIKNRPEMHFGWIRFLSAPLQCSGRLGNSTIKRGLRFPRKTNRRAGAFSTSAFTSFSSSSLWGSSDVRKMVITVSSLWGFSSAQVKLRHTSRSCVGSNQHSVWDRSSSQKINFIDPPPRLMLGLRSSAKDVRWMKIPSVTDSSNDTVVESSTTDSSASETETTVTNNQPPSSNLKPKVNGKEETSPQAQEPMPKRSPLTAREKVRAARVLSRYTEVKPAKPGLGTKVLDALRASDGGKKRSRLPEAPTNMLDDSKRGLPKAGLTFNFPGGADLFFIAFSFVFISTVMFATTYLVWKLGAIHFNEY